MPATAIIGIIFLIALAVYSIGWKFKWPALRRTGQLLFLMGLIMIILLVLTMLKM